MSKYILQIGLAILASIVLFSSTTSAAAPIIQPNIPGAPVIRPNEYHLFMERPKNVQINSSQDVYVWNACLGHSVNPKRCYGQFRGKFNFSGSGYTDIEQKMYIFHQVKLARMFYKF